MAAVNDTEGHPVARGNRYFVTSPEGRGMGMLFPKNAIPPNVCLTLPNQPGLSVELFPEGKNIVYLKEPVSFKFTPPPKSTGATQWKFYQDTGFVMSTDGSAPDNFSLFTVYPCETPGQEGRYVLWSYAKKDAQLGITGDHCLLHESSTPLAVQFHPVPD